MIVETTLDRVPCGVIFWKHFDGVTDRGQEYAPRHSYVKLDDSDTHDVRDLNEFGRNWTFSDCGLTPHSPVRTTFQPIANRFGAAAQRALESHA